MYILFFISIFCLITSITLFIINIYKKKKAVSKNQEQFSEKLTKENLELLQIQAELKKEVDILSQNKMLLADEQDRLTKLLKKYREDGYESVNREVQKQRQIEEQRIAHENSVREHELIKIYWKKKSDLEAEYEQKKEELSGKLNLLQSDVADFQNKVDTINRATLRQKELEEKEDFYSIIIPENDKEDIQSLQSLDLRLHNRNVLPKLIWDLFVRRPVQEMIKRVLAGRESTSGIYKVTNKQTGESYIGRSSNIGTRWQNHCKTAIGLESAASSTFHTRLAKDGIWNYTWEVLEEVPKEKLGEREAFYIDLYGTKQQLNMRAGS